MDAQRLGDDVADPPARIERGEGSWKIICIWRRTARNSPHRLRRDVLAFELILPEVMSYSRTRQRPSVDFPQPDLTDQPQCLARHTHRRRRRRRRARSALAGKIVLPTVKRL